MFPYIAVLGRKIGTYGLCMAIGILLAGLLSAHRGRRQGLAVDDLLVIAAFALMFALPCGAILYAFVTFSPEQILHSVLSGDFSVFGGLVFYGGLVGGIFGALIGLRIVGVQFRVVENAVVPYIPVGHAVGRVGCVMAGCCNGMPYDGPFAIYYPRSAAGLSTGQGYFPVQLVEAISNVIICIALLIFARKQRKSCSVLFAYLGLYAVSRFFLEFFRGDSIRGIYYGLSVSQWIALGMLLMCIVFFAFRGMKKLFGVRYSNDQNIFGKKS